MDLPHRDKMVATAATNAPVTEHDTDAAGQADARRPIALLLAAMLLLPCVLAARQSPPQADRPRAPNRAMLPDSAVAAIEIADPGAAIGQLLAALGAVPDGLPATARQKIAITLTAVTAALGGTPRSLAERVAAGGAVVGFVPHAGSLAPVAILRPGDADQARRWLERTIGAERCAIFGGWLLVAAEPDDLADLRLHVAAMPSTATAAGPEAGRWAGIEPAMAMVDGRPAVVRAVIDLDAWRRHAGTRWPRTGEIGLLRFLSAPIADALERASFLRVSMAGGERLAIDWLADVGRRGEAGGGMLVDQPRAWPRLPEDLVLSLRLERSLHRLFAEPESFLTADQVLGVQGFLSIADGLDGPRTSFVRDGLGGLAEPIDLLVFGLVPQSESAAVSPLQVPQFAFVTRIVGDQTEAMLLRMSRLFATIVNTERGQQGKRAFLVRQRSADDGAHGLVAEPREWDGPGRPPVEQQLTPTLWFDGDHVALASTQAAAMAAVRAAAGGEADAADAPGDAVGDRIVLRGAAVAAVLRQNRDALVLGRVLDEGESPAQADEFFRVVESVADEVAFVELTLAVRAHRTSGSVRLERKRPAAGAPEEVR